MRFFLLLFLTLPSYTFSQSIEGIKHRITIGSNLQIARYNYQYFYSGNSTNKYIDDTEFGTCLDVRLNYQNHFSILACELGLIATPIDPDFIFQSQLKGSFNLMYKQKYLKNHFGPYLGFGYLFPPNKYESYNLKNRFIPAFGLMYSSKYIQLEVGTLFRQNRSGFLNPDIFKNCFYTSIGFRIPLKKEPKN